MGEEFFRRKTAGELPNGQFPTLTVGSKVFCQSHSIAKYAAKVGGLMPSDPLKALEVEQMVDCTEDVRAKWVHIRYSGYRPVQDTPEVKKEKYTDFYKNLLPPFLQNFERWASQYESGYLVGDGLTL